MDAPMEPARASAASDPGPLRGGGSYSRRQAHAIVAAMALVTLSLGLVQMPISLMVDPVRQSLGISDMQISLLLGAATAVPFVLMSLVGGWLSDRVSRRLLLGLAMLVWTLGGVISALAESFDTLLAARVLLALGAGVKLPVIMTWINDAYPAEQRGRAIGAFFVVLGVGPSAAVMLTGAVQRAAEGGAFTAWAFVQTLEPWRVTTLMLALPGLALLPLVLALRDFRSCEVGDSDTPGSPAAGADTMPLGLIVLLATAASLVVLVDGANLAWMPTVFTRHYGYDAQQAGFTFGVVTLLAGSLGPLIGGWLGDHLYRRHGTPGRVWLAAGACLCSVPLLAVYAVQAPAWLTVSLTLNGLCTVAALATTYVNAQALLPQRSRGVGTGLISAATALVGSAGPTLVAYASEHVLRGPMALPQSIALVGSVGSLVAALVLAAGASRLTQRSASAGSGRTTVPGSAR